MMIIVICLLAENRSFSLKPKMGTSSMSNKIGAIDSIDSREASLKGNVFL